MVVRLHCCLSWSHQLDQRYQEQKWQSALRRRSFAAMAGMENGRCSVCVEGLVAGEWKLLQFVDGSLSGFEGVAER